MDETPFPMSKPPTDDPRYEAVILSPDTPKPLSPVEQELKDAEKAAAARPVKVKVLPRLRVVHEGKPYVGGETLSVPAAKAVHWIKHKFVELVPAKSKSASQKGES